MATNKRERELARLRAERQAARRAQIAAERQKRRNSIMIGLTALAVLAVVTVIALTTRDGKKDTVDAFGATPSASTSASAQPSASPSGAAAGTCVYSKSGTAAKPVSGEPKAAGPASTKPVPLTLTTDRGAISLTLNADKAPCTTNSFTFLAAQKYFDGTSCHRLTTSGIFVLQCGDPSGTGGGGPGYQYPDENLTALGTPNAQGQVIYPRGTVAMANGGPGTNGSQFFLVYKDSPLAPSYTPFGTITQGLELLDQVAAAGSTPVDDGAPNKPVKIERVTL